MKYVHIFYWSLLKLIYVFNYSKQKKERILYIVTEAWKQQKTNIYFSLIAMISLFKRCSEKTLSGSKNGWCRRSHRKKSSLVSWWKSLWGRIFLSFATTPNISQQNIKRMSKFTYLVPLSIKEKEMPLLPNISVYFRFHDLT